MYTRISKLAVGDVIVPEKVLRRGVEAEFLVQQIQEDPNVLDAVVHLIPLKLPKTSKVQKVGEVQLVLLSVVFQHKSVKLREWTPAEQALYGTK